jgi:hypothetical protein
VVAKKPSKKSTNSELFYRNLEYFKSVITKSKIAQLTKVNNILPVTSESGTVLTKNGGWQGVYN